MSAIQQLEYLDARLQREEFAFDLLRLCADLFWSAVFQEEIAFTKENIVVMHPKIIAQHSAQQADEYLAQVHSLLPKDLQEKSSVEQMFKHMLDQ